MNEKIISVVTSEMQTSKTGKPYLQVVDQDNVKFSCWDEALWNTLGKNAGAKIGFEVKGIFKNIIQAETVELPINPEPEDTKEPKTKVVAEGSKIKDPKNRAFALSYAKDLAVAGAIEPTKILSYAEVFTRYIDGDITVKDEEVFTALIHKTFKIKEEP